MGVKPEPQFEGIATCTITFYHDIEQNIDSKANPVECRKVTMALLELEKKHKIPSTYNIVGRLFREQPDLIESICNADREIAFHSYNHQADWKPEYYADEIVLCKSVSALPCGYRSPRSQWNDVTLKKLWENKFIWNAEYENEQKEPYYIYKDLVRLPIADDDWRLHKGDLSVGKWIDGFCHFMQDRRYFGFGSHDYITSFSPEERLNAWERILQIAIENKARVVTFYEAVRLLKMGYFGQPNYPDVIE